jgi:hypothetical protein
MLIKNNSTTQGVDIFVTSGNRVRMDKPTTTASGAGNVADGVGDDSSLISYAGIQVWGIPIPPTGDGNYQLTVSSGVYTWTEIV